MLNSTDSEWCPVGNCFEDNYNKFRIPQKVEIFLANCFIPVYYFWHLSTHYPRRESEMRHTAY